MKNLLLSCLLLSVAWNVSAQPFFLFNENSSKEFAPLTETCTNFYDGSMDRKDKYSDRVHTFDGHEQINHYHLHYYGEHEAFFQKISEIAHTAPGLAGGKGYYCNDDAQSDYFDRAYYVNIHVGKWDNPYEINLEGQRRTLKIAA